VSLYGLTTTIYINKLPELDSAACSSPVGLEMTSFRQKIKLLCLSHVQLAGVGKGQWNI